MNGKSSPISQRQEPQPAKEKGPRQSAELREPECVEDPRRFGHGDVVDVGWTQALFSYRGVARRRGSARASRHEENRQRGLGAARLRGDRGGGGCGVDAATSRPLPGAAFERALDSRHRYDGEAALRPSGRSGGGLQSQEAPVDRAIAITLTRWRARDWSST